MKLKGNWNGTHNRVFWSAQQYFANLQNESPANVKKRRLMEAEENLRKKSRQQLRMEKRALKSYNEELFRALAEVEIEGEVGNRVPVYDNCDEVRAKSQEFIDQCGLRTKEWLRLIGNVNTKSWNDFLSYSGAGSGAANRSYYAAYVFLEKVRIVRREEKSHSRVLAELEYGEAGRPLKHDNAPHEMSGSNRGIV